MANFVPFLISNWDIPDESNELVAKAKNIGSRMVSIALSNRELNANPEISAHELSMMGTFITELADALDNEILLNELLADRVRSRTQELDHVRNQQ